MRKIIVTMLIYFEISLLVLSLSACGIKGDLTLPNNIDDHKHEANKSE